MIRFSLENDYFAPIGEDRSGAAGMELRADEDVSAYARGLGESEVETEPPIVSGSFDYEAVLAGFGRLAVPYLADWCFLHLIAPGGSVRRLEPAHTPVNDPVLAREMARTGLFGSASQRRLGLLTNGVLQASCVDAVSEEWLTSLLDDREQAALLVRAGARRAILAPIVVHGRLAGALTLICGDCGRRYETTDLDASGAIAENCALAIETARLCRNAIRERDKAAQANRAKDEFLAILSHEIRNPLTPALAWSRILKHHDLIAQNSVLSEGVRSVERNLQGIAKLVDECLDLTRISQRKIQTRKETLNLNEVLQGATEAVREMARSKGLYLGGDFCEEPLWLSGDSTRLQQVMMNLLVNAIRHTPTGGAIWVRSETVGEEAEIEVQDSGEGIDPKFLEQIFEPFRQGADAWLSSESGLGLGLAISRGIVQMHGGRIWAESEGLGRGSIFRVRLPLGAAGSLPDGLASQSRAQLVQSSAGATLLLIEDSQDIVDVMKLELETLGYSVIAATDGAAGLQQAREEQPDLIISDVKMPGMDGFELIKAIRSAPELSGIPAIALTGFTTPGDVARLRSAGFDAWLPKPADVEDIFAQIQALMAQNGQRKAAGKGTGAG